MLTNAIFTRMLPNRTVMKRRLGSSRNLMMDRLLLFLSPLILWIWTLDRAVMAVSEPEKKEEHPIKQTKPRIWMNALSISTLEDTRLHI